MFNCFFICLKHLLLSYFCIILVTALQYTNTPLCATYRYAAKWLPKVYVCRVHAAMPVP